MLCTVTALNELQNIAPPALPEINAFIQDTFATSLELKIIRPLSSNPWIHLVVLPYDEADLHSNIPWLAISSGTACSSSTIDIPRSYKTINSLYGYIYRISL
jgi:hypothetical protein